jgi:hypothetical protein
VTDEAKTTFEAPEPTTEPEPPDPEDETPGNPPTEPEPEPEGEPEPEPEPTEPEPTEPQGATPEQWDERWKKSERAFATYTKRITELWEDDATELVPVALSPGAPPGFLYLPDAGRVPDELKLPVMEFFGIAREQDYADDPFTVACVTCHGKGATRTGSAVPGQEKRTCPTCAGKGFTVVGQPEGNGAADVSVGPGPALLPSDDFPRSDVDNWGEPRILPDGRPNPNFGKQPQFKELVEPWGTTANLNAQDVTDAPV